MSTEYTPEQLDLGEKILKQIHDNIESTLKVKPLIPYQDAFNASIALQLAVIQLQASRPQQEAGKEEGESVAFVDWVADNQFTKYNGLWKSTKIHYSPDQYTTEQLHSLYLQSLQNK